MRNTILALAAATSVGVLFAFAPGCRHDEDTHPVSPNAGPMEKAGAKTDEAGHEVKEDVKEAAHDTKDGAKEVGHETKEGAKGAASAVGSAVEKTGEKMKPKN
ncbi:MAG: hypothetical protein NVS3B10_16090 [Polyangiales bacterium]